jgi:hypothetical protein
VSDKTDAEFLRDLGARVEKTDAVSMLDLARLEDVAHKLEAVDLPTPSLEDRAMLVLEDFVRVCVHDDSSERPGNSEEVLASYLQICALRSLGKRALAGGALGGLGGLAQFAMSIGGGKPPMDGLVDNEEGEG